jgi:hypothetical protein
MPCAPLPTRADEFFGKGSVTERQAYRILDEVRDAAKQPRRSGEERN